MRYTLVSFFRRAIAVAAAFFMTLFGGKAQTPAEKERPEANTVSPYAAEDADYTLTIDAGKEKHEISDMLFGIFFEDINFAADGGLYAELVANRSFEFTALARDDQLYGYAAVNGAVLDVQIDDKENALNENNTNYLLMTNPGNTLAGIENRGFLDGISVVSGESYRFSVYAKGLEGYAGALTVRIRAGEAVAAEGKINEITDAWAKYTLTLTSSVTANEEVYLQVLMDEGAAALDMISLFPADTYKGRENGLRKDLVEKLEALNPRFLRFPGGCVIEGYDENTAYSWKDSVGVGRDGAPLEFNGKYGDVAARKQGTNIWTDLNATEDPWPGFMSYGLGFYEFFQLCEDIGASPVPVLNAALYCQMRGMHGEEDESAFEGYIRDMLDLVEFAKGDETTVWGKVRVSLGHPAPFDLKYIAIGNENEAEEYFQRYSAFLNAFQAAKAENPDLYEGVELIYSAGAADAINGWNHEAAYAYAKAQLGDSENAADFAGAIDEHYYQTPKWFLQNADYYDENNYRRSVSEMTDTVYGGGIPVFLGEYAAQSNTLRAALAEAAYMTGLERNGDIVRMACYAPLFSSGVARHWAPNLIWFNNHVSTGSVNYYAQKLFSNNTGAVLLQSALEGAAVEQPILKGRVGVGTWYTEAAFDNLKVVDNATGKVLLEDKFSFPNFWWNWENANKGNFKIRGGKLVHVGTEMNYSDIGDVAYTGFDGDMTNYTFTVEATKTDGEEGFLIPFAVGDKENNYFWNLGGWQNTVSVLQKVEDGVKTGQIRKTLSDFTVETGRTYQLKIEVEGALVRCYVDGEKVIDYDTGNPAEAQAYHVVSKDESGDMIIKLVNVTEEKRTFAVSISNLDISGGFAKVSQLAGESYEDENILGEKETCAIEDFTLPSLSDAFNFTVPPLSVTVIRIPAQG